MDAHWTIITCYHFGPGEVDAYDRLLRCLRSSLREVGEHGRIILVANGVREGAADPDRVIKDLDPSHPDRITPVVLSVNACNVGGLNAGVSMAIRFSSAENEWVGSVQSSVVLKREWLGSAFRAVADNEEINAVFGRLLIEEAEDTIWADGHRLCQARTTNINYNKSTTSSDLETPGSSGFPCLSAAFFHKDLVQKIVEHYGEFVCEHLPHYGDCSDVALRARTVAKPHFAFCVKSVATKRPPVRDRGKEVCSQLVAARRYYDRYDDVEKRITENLNTRQYVVDAVRNAKELLKRQYSSLETKEPKASWGSAENWIEQQAS